MGQYFWVYFSTQGRLPRDLYYIYGVPVIVLLSGLTIYLNSQFRVEGDPPSALWLGPLILLYWMQACVTARRLHDCSYSGALAVAIAAILAFEAASAFFPELLLGIDEETQSSSRAVIDIMFLCARWGFRLTCATCILNEGFSGENPYGQPLGTLNRQAQQSKDERRRERLKSEYGDPLPSPVAAASVVNQFRSARPAQSGGQRRTPAETIPVRDSPAAPAPRLRRPGEFGRRSIG